MQTRSAPACADGSKMRRLNSSAEPHSLRSTTAVGNPALRARSRPKASALLAIDQDDLGLEPAVGDAVDQVLQRRAGAAEEHGETDGCHCVTRSPK